MWPASCQGGQAWEWAEVGAETAAVGDSASFRAVSTLSEGQAGRRLSRRRLHLWNDVPGRGKANGRSVKLRHVGQRAGLREAG